MSYVVWDEVSGEVLQEVRNSEEAEELARRHGGDVRSTHSRYIVGSPRHPAYQSYRQQQEDPNSLFGGKLVDRQKPALGVSTGFDLAQQQTRDDFDERTSIDAEAYQNRMAENRSDIEESRKEFEQRRIVADMDREEADIDRRAEADSAIGRIGEANRQPLGTTSPIAPVSPNQESIRSMPIEMDVPAQEPYGATVDLTPREPEMLGVPQNVVRDRQGDAVRTGSGGYLRSQQYNPDGTPVKEAWEY